RVQPPDLVLGMFALGNVTRNRRKASQLAVFVTQRGDDKARPIFRAILAHLPALVLEPAFRRGDRQRLIGLFALGVARGVKAMKPPADDFLRPISHDPLGARIPRRDSAMR